MPQGAGNPQSLIAASELLRSRKLSPVELTRTCLDRINRLNPTLNAFIVVTADSALDEARRAEDEIHHGNWRGPLHGIPIAIKDIIDIAGLPTTSGSAVFKNNVAQKDAEVVHRLKSSGCVIVGKTNLHECAYGGSSVISAYGPVRNPWNHARIAGGSSGGSAAAIAAGLCYGALGTDTGGSIRQPSAYCGIVGLKATFGLLSTDGVMPLAWSLDHVGPMARTAADCAALMDALAGNGREYSTSLNVQTKSLRLGIPRALFYADLDPEIEKAINIALTVLQQLTSGAKEIAWTAKNDVTVLRAEAWAYHVDHVAKTPELYQSETMRRLRGGSEITTVEYARARHEQDELRRNARAIFRDVDLLITPTTPIPPPEIDALLHSENSRPTEVLTLRNTRPFDINGVPTISVPCGFTSAGLPIGLQISGPTGGERSVLALAHAYEQATEWHTHAPPV